MQSALMALERIKPSVPLAPNTAAPLWSAVLLEGALCCKHWLPRKEGGGFPYCWRWFVPSIQSCFRKASCCYKCSPGIKEGLSSCCLLSDCRDCKKDISLFGSIPEQCNLGFSFLPFLLSVFSFQGMEKMMRQRRMQEMPPR